MDSLDSQVMYLGRWVPRNHFRTYIYNATGSKLVNSYAEFSDHISSGIWYAEESAIPKVEDNVVEIDQKKKSKACQNLAKT